MIPVGNGTFKMEGGVYVELFEALKVNILTYKVYPTTQICLTSLGRDEFYIHCT
jgi:hypothetical protein